VLTNNSDASIKYFVFGKCLTRDVQPMRAPTHATSVEMMPGADIVQNAMAVYASKRL
jgi:hypothetical protein